MSKKAGGIIALVSGLALGAAALFLSKKENREKTKAVAKKVVAKAKTVVKKAKVVAKKNVAKAKSSAKKVVKKSKKK